MDISEVVAQAREAMTVRRVYGDPYEKDGVTIIPAAKVRGSGGVGRGKKDKKRPVGGYQINATPVGAYVIREGKVRWQPALNLNRVILGGQIVGALAVVGGIVRATIGARRQPWWRRVFE
jgi:uncharacterized spore protein YtfJ